jgi:hypothetical membrane protein
MITSKIKKRHLLLSILLVVGLVLSLVGVALYRGEQHPDAETFRLVFYLSMLGTVVFAILLAIRITYSLRRKKSPMP